VVKRFKQIEQKNVTVLQYFEQNIGSQKKAEVTYLHSDRTRQHNKKPVLSKKQTNKKEIKNYVRKFWLQFQRPKKIYKFE